MYLTFDQVGVPLLPKHLPTFAASFDKVEFLLNDAIAVLPAHYSLGQQHKTMSTYH